jgi:hypothetical protein
MTIIDPKEAASALSEIKDIAQRVRQSTIYNLASLMMIMWGALTSAGYLVTYLWPHHAGYAWIAVDAAGLLGSFVLSSLGYSKTRLRSFDVRALLAFLLFAAFGMFASLWLGHFNGRQLSVFWPIYFMLAYTIVGLWVGNAFVAIGLSITVLTLIGYFYVGPWFDLWMAFVNGGGLILGGLWMRRS